MTTYRDREASVADSEPVELYEFTREDSVEGASSWRYANGESAIVFQGLIYSATPGIHRSNIQQTGETTSMQATVTIPRTACVTDALSGPRSPAPIKLTIYRWQRGLDSDTEFAVLYRGEIAGSVFAGSLVELTCQAEESSWSDGLTRVYTQRMCPHMLYDTFCGADAAARTVALKLLTISDDLLTITVEEQDVDESHVGMDSHYYVNGYITFMGREVFVTAQDTNTLTLQTPLVDIEADDLFTGTAGCNRTQEDCDTIHDNVDRFGGFPLMPDRSPWLGVN